MHHIGAGVNRFYPTVQCTKLVQEQNKTHIGGTKMKFNKWTLGLAAVGVVSLSSVAQAEEKMNSIQAAMASTTISGYVDTSIQWNPGTQVRDGNVGQTKLTVST
jgi:hypothetical protein